MHNSPLLKEVKCIGNMDKNMHLGLHREGQTVNLTKLRKSKTIPNVVHEEILPIIELPLSAIIIFEDKRRT